jgi:ATP-dependent DNA ligase
MARLEGGRTRLFSRRGVGGTGPSGFRASVRLWPSLRAQSAALDGEAVVCRPKTALSLFDRLHSGRFDREAVLYGFDLLELNGDDLRALPLEQRKANLAELLAPACRRNPAERAHRGRRRDRVPARLPARLRGHRVEPEGRALPLGPGPNLD